MNSAGLSTVEEQARSYDQRRELFLNAFEKPIEPVATSVTYRLGILAVSVLMFLLPLIYISIIALVGYGVYFHIINNVGILSEGRGRGKFVVFLVYVAPMIAGGFLFVFMLKPLFARSEKSAENRKLNPEEEPLLFDFVHKVCDSVHAPRPKTIEIDMTVNASASFRRGFMSMLTGNDLRLTIGSPLIAGLDSRQFAGVLAHEFGHFSQGAGMRLTYVIRTISYWLTRAVYERDHWDDRLKSLATENDIRIGFVFHITRLCVWLTRRILWCLMWVGHAVSGYMLRQMEFDADRHETRLAGSGTFELTARRLTVLNFANRGAINDLEGFYKEGRLGNDMSELIADNVNRFDQATLSKINSMVDSQVTKAFDTHPCDTDRIANAKRENTDGIFRVEQPSSDLFRDFGTLSQELTLNYYKEILGESVGKEKLFDTSDLLERRQEIKTSFEALNRFSQKTFDPERSQNLARNSLRDLDNLKQRLIEQRKAILEQAANQQTKLDAWRKTDNILADVSHAKNLLGIGFKITADNFSVPLTSLKQTNEVYEKAKQTISEQERELQTYETICRERLASALSLFECEAAKDCLPNLKNMETESTMLISIFNKLHTHQEEFSNIQIDAVFLNIILRQIQDGADEPTVALVKQKMSDISTNISVIKTSFDKLDYPFDHADSNVSIGKFLVEAIPDHESPVHVMNAAIHLVNELPQLQSRIFGRLSWIAEQLESSIGLEPLPMPDSSNDDESEPD